MLWCNHLATCWADGLTVASPVIDDSSSKMIHGPPYVLLLTLRWLDESMASRFPLGRVDEVSGRLPGGKASRGSSGTTGWISGCPRLALDLNDPISHGFAPRVIRSGSQS